MAEPKARTASPISKDAFEPAMPTSIGPYTPTERLGSGGFGIVYRATQSHPVEREVAVKVLRSGLESPQVLARFNEERRFLARLDHPDVVRILDAGVTGDGRLYVVMDLVRGKQITDYVHDAGLGIGDRLRLFARVCRAVHAVHQRGVIHRDLKPSNIVVSEYADGPRPRIIDFGIAAALDAEDRTGWTQVGAPIGTPRYASPEQTTPSGVPVDTRTDIYALGVILGEMLCGRTIRAHTSGAETSATPPSKAALDAGDASLSRRLRGDLDRIVLKAAAWERSRRYDSAASLADDVERHLAGLPVHATPPGRLYTARKFVGRHRFATGAAVFAVVALLAGLGVAVRSAEEANRQRWIAEANSKRVAVIGSFLLTTIERNADPDALSGQVVLDETELGTLASEAIAGLTDDPFTMLDLLEKIGLIQHKLGMYVDAGENFRIAAEHATRLMGGPDERSVRLMMLRAQTYDNMHAKRQDAAALKQRALSEAETIFDENDPRLLSIRLRSPIALDELQRIVEILDGDPTARPDDVIAGLTAVYWRTELGPTPSLALPYARRSYERAKQHFGPRHSLTVNNMVTYASAESVYGSPEVALELILEALDTSIKVFGSDHQHAEIARRVVARVYGEAGRPELGIPHAMILEEQTRRQHGEGSIPHAGSLRVLGTLQAQAGFLESARETLALSLAATLVHWPKNNGTVTSLQARYADVLAQLGAFDEADEVAAAALEVIQNTHSPVPAAMATGARAAALRSRGDHDAADHLIADLERRFREQGIEGAPVELLRSYLTD